MTVRKIIIALLLFTSVKSFGQALIATADIFKSIRKTANWQIDEIQKNGWRYPTTDWTNGAYFAGQMAWANMANDDKQLEFLKSVGEKNNWKGGPERFFADDYCVGQTYSQLFMLYKDSAMIKPMIELGDDILKQPHTESLLWNFDGGLHNREWAWCDALFMGPPTLAYLYKVTGNKKYLDGMNKLWWRTSNYLYDNKEHLYFRDSRFFEKKEKNGAKVFWSRGNGWVMVALTRILDNMPSNYPDRQKYEKIFVDMSKRISSLQQPDGTWHASLLDPESYPIKETSGTAFFTYALSWGINHGYLSYQQYFPTIKKAWDALENCVHENGKLGYVQVPGAAPEKVTFEDTEVYGVGAYLLAGTELFKMMFDKEEASKKIVVHNALAIDRRDEMVELPWAQFAALKFTPAKIIVVNAQTNEEVPSQVIYNGTKTPAALIFQSGVTAGSAGYYYFKKQTPKEYAAKTFGRFVPERFDDFAWENNKIAFRMYGPALQRTGEISSGIDVWAKRTNDLVINKWYKAEDYHKDHGEGLDFYGVGKTLGAGGIAPFINDKLYPSDNYVTYKVLDNGPLRTSFQLVYKAWKAGNVLVGETKVISLDAGSFLNKIEEKYSFTQASLSVAVGIAKISGDGQYWVDPKKGLAVYSQPQQKTGAISVGIIVPKACVAKEITVENANSSYINVGQYLLITSIKNKQPLTYYQGASWDKEGTFQNFEQWKQYIINRQAQLSSPLVLSAK
ncbi:MAG TPA: glycoside hydrolase family 88 protein [Chitinophagaceae bacterium]